MKNAKGLFSIWRIQLPVPLLTSLPYSSSPSFLFSLSLFTLSPHLLFPPSFPSFSFLPSFSYLLLPRPSLVLPTPLPPPSSSFPSCPSFAAPSLPLPSPLLSPLSASFLPSSYVPSLSLRLPFWCRCVFACPRGVISFSAPPLPM